MATLKIIVFYLLLLDSLAVNLLAWGNSGWYVRHFRLFSRYFPITTGWAGWYLVLVVWIGLLTF